jgi:hypothetical protein
MSHKDVEFARDRFFSIASEFYAGHLTLPKLCRLRVLRLQQGAYRFLEKPTGFLAKFYHSGWPSSSFYSIYNMYTFSCVLPHPGCLHSECHCGIFKFRPALDFQFPRAFCCPLFTPGIFAPSLGGLFPFFSSLSCKLIKVGADAHFHGLRGRFAYLRRPICLIDMVVLVASFALLFWPNGNDHPNASAIVHPSPSSPPVGFLRIGQFLPVANSIAIDKFRFFQILRSVASLTQPINSN